MFCHEMLNEFIEYRRKNPTATPFVFDCSIVLFVPLCRQSAWQRCEEPQKHRKYEEEKAGYPSQRRRRSKCMDKHFL